MSSSHQLWKTKQQFAVQHPLPGRFYFPHSLAAVQQLALPALPAPPCTVKRRAQFSLLLFLPLLSPRPSHARRPHLRPARGRQTRLPLAFGLFRGAVESGLEQRVAGAAQEGAGSARGSDKSVILRGVQVLHRNNYNLGTSLALRLNSLPAPPRPPPTLRPQPNNPQKGWKKRGMGGSGEKGWKNTESRAEYISGGMK